MNHHHEESDLTEISDIYLGVRLAEFILVRSWVVALRFVFGLKIDDISSGSSRGSRINRDC